MLIDVLHFSFTVADIDASVEWYTGVLGLDLVHRQRQDNGYTRELVGIPDAVLEIAQFRLHGAPETLSTHMLELVQYETPAGEALSLSTNNVGVAHLAFIVDDAAAEYARLRSHGVIFRNPPTTVTEGANRGASACYFSDPDGLTFELMELAGGPGTPGRGEIGLLMSEANRSAAAALSWQAAPDGQPGGSDRTPPPLRSGSPVAAPPRDKV